MKKSGALIKCAARFTATVMAVTVAVSLCAGLAGGCIQLFGLARNQLRPRVEYLAAKMENSGEEIRGELQMLQSAGFRTWVLSENEALPENRHRLLFSDEYDVWFEGGQLYILTQKGDIALAAPVKGLPMSLICALIAALLSVGTGLAYGRHTIDKCLKPAVEPVAKLRDAAVSMADGHLETRADEHVDGELGELGKALNHLSDQLSRNMYTLIVERNRLRNMLNGLSEGIVAINAEGRVTHTNPALGKLISRAKPGTHFADPRMKTIPDATIWADFDHVMATGEAMTRNLESKDMILRMTVTPIVDEIDAIAGAVGLFSDITQMERLEKTRRDYVSNVNHELRTPLTAMRALIEPLKEGMVTEEADRQRYYDIILREIMRLSRLINDQLELSRLQSGTLSIQKSKMALDDLVYDVCDRYAAIAEEHSLKLTIDTDFSACPQVYANADRVEQMLIILLDNAIKYTEEGSVGVSATWDNEKVVVTVKDTGIGIEESDLPYVFDRFYKVDKAHSGKGSGLGLSIASELLKRMDEKIWVESEKGVGSAFSFTIHRNPPEENNA